MINKAICLYLYINLVLSAKFPSEISKCSHGDSKCISAIINDIFQNKFKGFPQLGLPPLDPLRIEKMDLEQGGQSPVNIKLNFRNITFVGLANAVAYKVSGFNQNPQGDKLEIRFKTPKITIAGPYTINGKVLILPIQGDGLCDLTLDNVDLMMRFHTKKIERNGKTFMQIDKSKMNFETTRLHMHLSNLFNGNVALGDNMNLFLNENWQDILKELKMPIIDGFGRVFTTIINHVFNSFPYSDLFAQ